ncbi:MAG: metal-sensitive transcriptional regulator [Patescibacteria group bacterium]
MKIRFKKQATNRLHRLQGQLRGLENMVQSGKYCMDILVQTAAVQKSLSGFNLMILENHLQEHSFKLVKNRQEAKALAELIKLYKISNFSS